VRRAATSPGIDFGTRAANYVDAVMANLHWERIAARYRRVRHGEPEDVALFTPFGARSVPEHVISVEELRNDLERDPPTLLDVCIAPYLPRRTDMLPGATIHNPDAIDQWASALPRDKPIVVYCFFGFQISGNAVTELRRRGYDARGLKGGIGAWHAIGAPTIPLDQSTYES
jgi:Fe-Mn family superoxide dismutase